MPTSLQNGLGGPAGFGEFNLTRNDDGYTSYIDLRAIFGAQGINFFGRSYTGLYLNNNGSVTFNNGTGQYTPTAITGTTSNPIIAPFWADVDTRGGLVTPTLGGTSTGTNLLWYDLDPVTHTFTATWDDVGYFSAHTNKLNSFQLSITQVNANGDFDIVFRYENIDWTTGDASSGVNGLGGVLARAGYSSGNGVNYFELPAAGNQNALLNLENTSNVGTAGTYVFNVRNGAATPSISIGDTAIAEGNGPGSTYVVVPVFLAAPSATAITVQYSTANGTAVAGQDYVDQSGILTFAPGVTQQNIFIEVIGDTVSESNEAFFVNLSNPVNAPIADSQGQVTIVNDDGLAISDVALLEGTGASSTAFTFTVSLLTASASAVTVNWATEAGTATSGVDFTDASGSLTFAAGEVSKTVTVNVVADSVTEANETFNVRLSGATGAVIADDVGVGTIINDDGLVVDDLSVIEGTAATPADALVTIRLLTAAAGAVTVDWATTPGTATNPGDFTASSGTVTFAAGETVKTVAVPVVRDAVIETGEAFGVVLSNAVGAVIVDGQAAISLVDDDGFSVGDAVVTEGNAGTTTMSFLVTLGSALTTAATIDYSLAGVTATAGTDFSAGSGTLSFAAGETSKVVTVAVAGDLTPEADETLTLTLANASAGTGIVRATATGIIFNDDGLSIGDATITEGNSGSANVAVTVTLSAAAASPITVNYATQDATAVAGLDYTATSGTLTFAVGETSKTVLVAVTGETVFEGNETFRVLLSSPTNTVLVDASSTVTIVNDDTRPPPSLRVIDAALVEGTGAGNSVMRFQVALSELVAANVTVQYATSNGTAIAGGDYTAATGTLTIAAGSLFGFIDVPVVRDSAVEANETLTITLSNPSAGTVIATATATGTILNDDVSLAIAATNANLAEGQSGITPFTFTVTRTGDSSVSHTVDYAIAANGSLNATDFAGGVLPSGSVSFAAGETSKTITINVAGDAAVEGQENFTVTLSNPSTGAAITTASAVGRIFNDDARLAITATDADKAEGQSGTTPFTFTVTRTGDTTVAHAVSYAVGGAGVTGADFASGVLPSGTVTFAVGETTKTVTIDVAGDIFSEGDEAFTVTLSNPGTGVTIGTASASGTIRNDDLGSHLITFSEYAVGTVNPVYTFSDNVVNVIGQIVVDSAQPQSPAVAANTTYSGPVYITFQNAVTHVAFDAGYFDNLNSTTIEIIGTGGQVLNTVTNTSLGIVHYNYDFAQGIAAIHVIDSATDAAGFSVDSVDFSGSKPAAPVTNTVSLAATNADRAEGQSGSTAYVFTVTRSGDLSAAASVGWAATGSAVSTVDANDFPGLIFPQGAVNFAAGEASKTITVNIAGDTTVEADETFTVTLFGASPGTGIGTAAATGTVRNDDVRMAIAATSADKAEGASGGTPFTFTVTRTGDSSLAHSVDYAVSGAGVTGADFVGGALPTGTVTFAAGETSKIITINVAGDTGVESDEAFTVTLSNPSAGAIITTAATTGTIRNDDIDSHLITFSEYAVGTINPIYVFNDNVVNVLGQIVVDSAQPNSPAVAANTTYKGPVYITFQNAVTHVDFAAGYFDNLNSTTIEIIGVGGQVLSTVTNTALGIVTYNYDFAEGIAAIHVIDSAVDDAGFSVDSVDFSGSTPAVPVTSTVAIAATNADRAEGQSGSSGFFFTVTRTGNVTTAASIGWAVTGTGANPLVADDFPGGIFPSGSVSFAAGETSKTIRVNIAGDTIIEANETFAVTLFGATPGVGIATASAIGVVRNDDPLLPGTSGPDYIDGHGGTFAMAGGLGDDTYVVDDAGDQIIEYPNEGTDTVIAYITWSLADLPNVENLTLYGGAPLGGTGNAAANNMFGNTGGNAMAGLAGDDLINGGAGSDSLDGGDGDDVLEGESGHDRLAGGNGTDYLDGGAGNDSLNAGAGDDYLDGGVGNDTLDGGDGQDYLDSGAGNDVASGGAGDDQVYGGDGNDTVNGNGGNDDIDAGAGADNVAGGDGNDTMECGAGSDRAYGEGGDDNIAGGVGNDFLNGGAGNDTVSGGDQDDWIYASTGTDLLDGGNGIDTLSAATSTAGANIDLASGQASFGTTTSALVGAVTLNTAYVSGFENIIGSDFDDSLAGDGGNNIIDGRLGADQMSGAAGNDTFFVDNSGDTVSEAALEGIDTVIATLTWTLSDNLEVLRLSGAANLDGTGNELDNRLSGNDGNNRLDGAVGADAMTGGLGDDTYVVDDAGDLVTEYAGEGTDTVLSSLSWILGANLENLTLIGSDDISGTGNTLANVLIGNSGINTLAGGSGNDTYIVDTAGDVLVESSSQGTDEVRSTISLVLGANIEVLRLTGSDNIDGTGNSSANTLVGNGGNNVLTGGTNADTMYGGGGDDTYNVDNVGDIVSETLVGGADDGGTDTVLAKVTYTLGAFLENLTLSGSVNMDGFGNSVANTIRGNTGNNLIDGAGGADTMVGGTGNDTYVVDDAGDVTTELSSGGTDTINSSITYTLLTGASIEILNLTGAANIDGFGNSIDNVLNGNAGNNILNGRGGADIMAGGAGDDIYVVDNVADQANELNNGGTDTVQASVSYALGSTSYIESLKLTGAAAIDGTGNGAANTITGNMAANTLSGLGGADILIGGPGDDILIGGSGNDIFRFGLGSGADTINDFFISQNDTIDIHAYSNGVVNGGGVTITQVGNNALIDLGGGNTVTVLNVLATASNFLSHITW